MTDTEEWTCGKGLAANADLPARLAEMLAARAEVLERHTRALDMTDENSRMESEAYLQLVRAHRGIANELEALAQQMKSFINLPMGRHDMDVMQDPRGQAEAFRTYVEVERGVVEFLREKVDEDEKYL